jgi:hypothetical protein
MKTTLMAVCFVLSAFVASALPLSIAGTQTKPTCTGDCDASITLVVSGGVAPYSYLWNTGETTSSISGLCADTFTVVVTDAVGATASQTRIIRDPYPVKTNFSRTDVSCYGACDGEMTSLPYGGTGAYSFLWSNGATTATISNLCAGYYTVTVTDANGCSLNCGCPRGILQPAELEAVCNVLNNESYAGAADGSLDAVANGGVQPYSYQWSNGATTAGISGLSAGIYTVTVYDDNGCSASSQCEITAPPDCGGFRTQTQGGWGQCQQNGNNPGSYLANNFAAAFPNGLVVGCLNTLTLTSSSAVCQFLPSGSTPKKLTVDMVDPSNSYKNVLAGQVVALTLNVGFDAYDANFGGSGTLLGGQIIVSGQFAGWSVQQLLDTANYVLGGCASQYSPSAINNAVSAVNENYVDGVQDHGFLACPGSSNRLGTTAAVNAEVFPNPFSGAVNIRIEDSREAKLTIMDLSGKVMDQIKLKGGTTTTAEQLKPGAYILSFEYNDGVREIIKILKTN